jgi:hypothetical protein
MPAPPAEHTDYQPAPAGSHIAYCTRLIDLGTQATTYNGKPRQQHKLYVEFQLTNALTTDGEPFAVGNRYTLSSSEKSTLRKHLESWRGKRFGDDEIAGFDLKRILGKPAIITTVHSTRTDKTYADLTAIAAIPKGTQLPPFESPTVFLSLDPEEFEPAVYESLSDALKAVIAKSPEFQSLEYSNGRTTALAATDRANTTEQAAGTDDAPF